MTTFPGSPRVLKGALVSINPLTSTPSVVAFQYNPDTLTRTLKPRSSGSDGARLEAQRLTGPPEETIKLDIEIDATDQLEAGDPVAGGVGIYPQISALELLVYPDSGTLIADTALLAGGVIEIVPAEGPLTLFIWGAQRIVPVRITECSFTEEAHDPALNPLRVKASLGLRVLSVVDLSITNPGYYMYLAHQIVKETLGRINVGNDLTRVLGENVTLR